MTDIVLSFLLPPDNREITAELDDTLTAAEIISELLAAGVLSPNPNGYELAVKGGDIIDHSQRALDFPLSHNSVLRVISPTDAGGGGMLISQTYLGLIDLSSEVFVYYFWEDYAGQVDIPVSLRERLAAFGYQMRDYVSVFTPMRGYLASISEELQGHFNNSFATLSRATPGLFICQKPLGRFDPKRDEYLFLPLPKGVISNEEMAEQFFKKLFDTCMLIVTEKQQSAPSSTDESVLSTLYDGLQLKFTFMGFGFDLKPILARLRRSK